MYTLSNLFKTIAVISFLTATVWAKSFNASATNKPLLVQSGNEKYWCPISGMSIQKSYKTSYTAQLQNGTKRQYSNIYNLVIDMQEYKIDKKSIKVIDVVSQKYIDVSQVLFFVKSKIMVIAVKSNEARCMKKFIKKYEGKFVNFSQLLKYIDKNLSVYVNKLEKKRSKRVYPKGKRIFEKLCNVDIDPTEYIEINELMSDIKFEKLCKPLKEKDLHAVSLYLWNVKRKGDLGEIIGKVEVQEHEKCPVCGMFTYKYPRWAAQIFYEENDVKKHWSFDGVKDLMKFYFNSSKWGNYPIAKRTNITKILVTDYYTQKGIDGTKAFYVIRSDIFGPMGHELIPFKSMEDAKTFKKDHFGTMIIKFSDIKENEVYKLDIN